MAWRALLAVRDVRRAVACIKVAGRAWRRGGRAGLGAAVPARRARPALHLSRVLLEFARLAQRAGCEIGRWQGASLHLKVPGHRRDTARCAWHWLLGTNRAGAPRLTEVAAVQGLQTGPVAETACFAWGRRGRTRGAVAAELANLELGLGLGLGSGLGLGLGLE